MLLSIQLREVQGLMEVAVLGGEGVPQEEALHALRTS